MEETRINRVELCGVPASGPVFSHEARGERFYTLFLDVPRLSGTVDRLPVLLREALLGGVPAAPVPLRVAGELRSCRSRAAAGPRLLIHVFAGELSPSGGEDRVNRAELAGTLRSAPVCRLTPGGRRIADLMLRVPRPVGRFDHLPCIVWGSLAREAALWDAGTPVLLSGRFQSREYVKLTDGRAERRVAYEISANEAARRDALRF